MLEGGSYAPSEPPLVTGLVQTLTHTQSPLTHSHCPILQSNRTRVISRQNLFAAEVGVSPTTDCIDFVTYIQSMLELNTFYSLYNLC